MKTYRLTCLTPLLAGDGQKLSPIDYMVWKNQVNVLDQRKIFRLLAKGPRLDSYLSQIRKAERLDFASWGGFAQNFAGRRIQFDDPAAVEHWHHAHHENLSIPTFAAGASGQYLPGSTVKGALRTGVLFARAAGNRLEKITTGLQSEGLTRRLGEWAERTVWGPPSQDRLRALQISDSLPAPEGATRIYLLRVAVLVNRGRRLVLGWKTSLRGSVDGSRPEDGAVCFAEMAAPGTVFSGRWSSAQFASQPDICKALLWKEPPSIERFLEAANHYAAVLLEQHKHFCVAAGLESVLESIRMLEERLDVARQSKRQCLLCLGWGTGYLSKALAANTTEEASRNLLRLLPHYPQAFRDNLPFPKTRKVIFSSGRPVALPGWALLELSGEPES